MPTPDDTVIPTLQTTATPQQIEMLRDYAKVLAGEKPQVSSFKGTPVYGPWNAAADAVNKMASGWLGRSAYQLGLQTGRQVGASTLGQPQIQPQNTPTDAGQSNWFTNLFSSGS